MIRDILLLLTEFVCQNMLCKKLFYVDGYGEFPWIHFRCTFCRDFPENLAVFKRVKNF